jgi:protoporphyrinogen oxidase
MKTREKLDVMNPSHPGESIAIVGGGITGIAGALELTKSRKYRVTIFEKADQLGGLNSPYRWQDLVCDRFYHVLLPSDHFTIEFLRQMGLADRLHWTTAKSGFYGKEKLVPFSSTKDFIEFPFLSLGQKFRLGLGILYSSRVARIKKLDQFSAPQWMKRVFGQKVYDSFWNPLVHGKLGEAADRTSAVFLGATIKRLYGARSGARLRENMGIILGGTRILQEAAEKRLSESGVEIRTGTPVEHLSYQAGKIVLQSPMDRRPFGKVLLAIPNPEILKIIQDADVSSARAGIMQTEYLGIICALLILNRSLSPYYLINVLDKSFPFTGIVESTNIIPEGTFGDKRLIYLPKYVTQDDPLNKAPDHRIRQEFTESLRKIFPDLRNEEILHCQILRENYVQPVHRPRTAETRPISRSPLPGVYLANASLMPFSTLNNNIVLKEVQETARVMTSESRP